MSNMFLFATNFNNELSRWDVSNVTTMSGMFHKASTFNNNLNAWNVSAVKDMGSMFADATRFNGKIENWDVSNVTSMSSMFNTANSFNGDLSKWDVGSVESMVAMFYRAEEFGGDVREWNVGNVKFMNYMFGGAVGFEWGLCWDWSGKDVIGMFEGSGVEDDGEECVTDIPTNTPTNTPTIIPSSKPTITPTNTQINKTINQNTPFQLKSSTTNHCLSPAHNALSNGTKLLIQPCNSWKTTHWTFSHENKLHNYHSPHMCITSLGKYLSIEVCVDGVTRQMWRVTNRNTVIALKNGNRGLTVVNDSQVKLTKLTNDSSQLWEVWRSSTQPLTLPNYETFTIHSLHSQHYCLYPTKFRLKVNARISLTPCKNWIPFQWTMDQEGKIHSGDDALCMTRQGARLQLSTCVEQSPQQRWVYSVLDGKLGALVNGRKVVSVVGNVVVDGSVKVMTGVDGRVGQMWSLERV